MKQTYFLSVFEWQQCGAVVCRLIPLSFHVSVWVPSGFSSFLPQSNYMYFRQIKKKKMTLQPMNLFVDIFFSTVKGFEENIKYSRSYVRIF